MDNKVIYLVIIALAFVFLFGLPLFYFGALNPSATSERADVSKYGGARYHVYNPLATEGLVAFFLGFIIFSWSLVNLRERIRATVPTILALLGVIFLFMSLYSFVSGFHDLLTFTSYETITKPTFGQQYGWFIQFVVYGIIGTALTYAAEHTRKNAGETRSIIPSITSPVGAFMLLSTLLLFVTGFHSFLYLTDYTEYRQSLAWVVETIIFGLASYYLLRMSDNINKRDGARKSIFAFPSASLGVIFILFALGVYLIGTAYYVYAYGTKTLNWLLEAFVYGALAVILTLKADDLYRKEGEESNSFSTSMYVAGVVLLLPAVIIFLTGFNEFLYSSSPDLKWFIEFMLLLIPGVLAIAAGEYTRRGQKPPMLPVGKSKRKTKE
ncbi:MAG: hypothetical protein NTY73_00905 [Candidatus Micrarchaeota archaeon]|nr:hypothetical protein [Candidatus Micrarchaeota archaeon]